MSPGAYSQQRKPSGRQKTIAPLADPDEAAAPVTAGTLRMQVIDLWRALQEASADDEAERSRARESERRADRRWLLKTIVLPVMLAIIAAASGAAITYDADKKSRAATTLDEKALEKVEEAVDQTVTTRLTSVETAVVELKASHAQQQALIIEMTQYLSAQLVALNPKAAKVATPPKLRK